MHSRPAAPITPAGPVRHQSQIRPQPHRRGMPQHSSQRQKKVDRRQTLASKIAVRAGGEVPPSSVQTFRIPPYGCCILVPAISHHDGPRTPQPPGEGGNTLHAHSAWCNWGVSQAPQSTCAVGFINVQLGHSCRMRGQWGSGLGSPAVIPEQTPRPDVGLGSFEPTHTPSEAANSSKKAVRNVPAAFRVLSVGLPQRTPKTRPSIANQPTRPDYRFPRGQVKQQPPTSNPQSAIRSQANPCPSFSAALHPALGRRWVRLCERGCVCKPGRGELLQKGLGVQRGHRATPTYLHWLQVQVKCPPERREDSGLPGRWAWR